MYSRSYSILSRTTLLGVLAITGIFVAPATAVAQQDSSATAIEEIVTTARRREESVRDVPLSITAISGDELDRIGAPDIIAVGQSTPNVTLEVSRGTNSTLSAFIRGVGQQDPVAGFESGIGIYLDDVYLNRPQAGVLDIYDVERIEVLRGPQGTLYGRNTIGGAIKYVTRDLADEATAKMRFSVGSYNQMDAVLTGSAPLSDTVRVGGSVVKLTRDGYGKNLNLNLENYNKDFMGLRGRIEWDASENFSVRLSADYSDDNSAPRNGHRETVAAVSGDPILGNVFDTNAGLNVPDQNVTAKGAALTAEWTLNDNFTLKNIISDRSDETWSPIDFDSLAAVDLDVPVVYTNDQFSEELQLLYSSDRLNGIVGYYMLDANAFNEFDVILGQLGELFYGSELNANTLGDVDTKSWSLFADFSYDVSDTVSVSVGGRYTSDKRSSKVLRRTFFGGLSETFGGTAVLAATTSDFQGSKTFTDFSPKVSVAWTVNDQHNAYATYSSGFKGGSFDPRSQSTAAPDLNGNGSVDAEDIFNFMMFEPETVDSYEVGLKSIWLDSRMTTNIAVFYADYRDVQVPGSIGYDSTGDGTNDSFIGVTSNAGKAKIPGIEFEGKFRADDNWSFGWAIGRLNAEYTQFINAFGVDISNDVNFQNTPDLTANLSVTYETPLALFGHAGSIAAISSVSYRGDSTQFETPIPLLDQGSFSLWDLSVVWDGDDGHWRAGIHGKNLSDTEYRVAGYNFPALGLEGNVTSFYGNPRAVTATVEYRF